MRALVLVDHGSKVAEANRLLEEVAGRVRARGAWPLVRTAHMELAPPTLAEAVEACVAEGATEVTIAQYFLSPGRHSTADIPRMARDAAARHPGVTVRVSEPLGVHDGIVDALLDRARETSP